MQDPIDPFAEFLLNLSALWTNALTFITGVLQPGWGRIR